MSTKMRYFVSKVAAFDRDTVLYAAHFCHFFLPTCNVCPLAIPESCAHNISLRLLEGNSLGVSFFSIPDPALLLCYSQLPL